MAQNALKPGSVNAPWFLILQIVIVISGLIATFEIQRNSHSLKDRPLHMAVAPDLVPHLVLGFTMIASDMYWVRTIQELDFKDGPEIEKGWVFQMLDTATNLNPRYGIIYYLGTVVLSVIVHDKEGARILLDKGVKIYPQDWMISYRAAYHYLYEMKDCKKAAKLFQQAGRNGAPPWVNSMAARLYNMDGQYELARSILISELQDENIQAEYRKEFQRRLDLLEESHRLGQANDFVKCSEFYDNLPKNNHQ